MSEKSTEQKPVTINFSGWSLALMLLALPLAFVAMIAIIVGVVGFGLVAIPFGMLVFVIVTGVIKLIDWMA